MNKKIEVVVIHGSHKHVEGVAKLGDTVSMTVKELKELDPMFSLKSGKGERFATPEVAKKLALRRQIDDELEAADELDDEDAQDEAEADEDAADDEAAEPAPTPPASPEAKKLKAKKGKG